MTTGDLFYNRILVLILKIKVLFLICFFLDVCLGYWVYFTYFTIDPLYICKYISKKKERKKPCASSPPHSDTSRCTYKSSRRYMFMQRPYFFVILVKVLGPSVLRPRKLGLTKDTISFLINDCRYK